jgi:hypothetical protein
MKIKQILIIGLLMFGTLYSQQFRDIPDVVTKVATSSANWLKLETDARLIGMGGVGVASGNGISAVPYNPANIGFIKGRDTYYSKSNYLAGITHSVIGFGTQLSSNDYFGVHLFYLDSGPIGLLTEESPEGGLGNYHVYNLALRLTYARTLTDRLKVGMTAKYIREDIHTMFMQTFAIDIGSNFDTGIYGFILGMSVSNFGPEVQFHGEGLEIGEDLSRITEKFALPLTFRLGVKNDIIGGKSVFIPNEIHRLTIAMDGINPIDYTVYGTFGVEYGWFESAFARAGMHFGHDTAGLSLGGGIKQKIGGFNMSIDYAYVNYAILETTHQFGISLGF